MPKARDHFATAVANGRIHVIGGRFNLPVDNTDMRVRIDTAYVRATDEEAKTMGGQDFEARKALIQRHLENRRSNMFAGAEAGS